MSYLHVPHEAVQEDKVTAHAQDETSAQPETTGEGQQEDSQSRAGILPNGTIPEEKEAEEKEEQEDWRCGSRSLRSSARSSGAERVEGRRGEGFQSDVRTIQQELDDSGLKRDPDDISAADLNPEFVHVQTLTKGMCFGLSDLILGEGSSFCVISNGADVLLVNKGFYEDHASEGLIRTMRQALCPYPSEEELQDRLQTSVDWDAYRQTTLATTLKSVRMRKDPPVRV